MNLTITRESLLTPLQKVVGVVEKRQTLPILANVLLAVREQELTLTATDLEVELLARTQAISSDLVEPITLPARKLLDICKALPEGAQISLTVDGSKVTVKAESSRFSLSTLPAGEFPNLDEGPGALEFNIAQGDLRQLIEKSYFAMAQQDVRYYLNGLLLEMSENFVRTVATDGHRLAMSTLDKRGLSQHRMQVIVPRKGVLELLRLLDDDDAQLAVTIGTNHIRISSENFTFTSKLIDGRFPDYNRVLPANADKIVKVERDELKHLLARVAILANEKYHGVRFELRTNELKLLANNPEQEEAEDLLRVEYDDADLDIGFNVNYLLDVLNVLPSGAVKLALTDGNSSVLIEDDSGAANNAYVVMPMRL